ncbi:urease accessory protein F [Klebsormidium nitens]|uniref:Urease accessory protein F n=1 Tax=Klebsormidium nitens TaxID=105231 RepID=A0A1Y1HJ63_KLENI|nr:urease accessory protein F [Klebsormidium nitens]|eukprot:GAQ78555.1 urease accessory protein F [Klebsormidium nitens]
MGDAEILKDGATVTEAQEEGGSVGSEPGLGGHVSAPGPSSNDWLTWQLVDSLLPTGGFAHSLGVEAAQQAGLLRGPSGLRDFLVSSLENVGALLLPFVYAGYQVGSISEWEELDAAMDATLSNHVANEASATQGAALLRVVAGVHQGIAFFKEMRVHTRASHGARSHHAPVFGVVCSRVGISSATAQRAYLFMALRDMTSAATRLNLIGPLEAAILQGALFPQAEAFAALYSDRPIEDARQTAPLLDIVQGGQDRLFSRLFRS